MNIFRLKSVFLLFCLSVMLMADGCAAANDNSPSADSTVAIPDTSTIHDRQEFLARNLDEPHALKPGEIAITIRIRPQFVLHLSKKLKVKSFEALNEEAVSLKRETQKKWKRKPYKKAIRHILEQAVIDGFLSDVSPAIHIQIDEEPDAAELSNTVISLVDLRSIEESVQQIAENVAAIHGITAEIVLHGIAN